MNSKMTKVVAIILVGVLLFGFVATALSAML